MQQNVPRPHAEAADPSPAGPTPHPDAPTAACARCPVPAERRLVEALRAPNGGWSSQPTPMRRKSHSGPALTGTADGRGQPLPARSPREPPTGVARQHPADPSRPAVGRDGFRLGRRRPRRCLSLDRRVHAQGAGRRASWRRTAASSAWSRPRPRRSSKRTPAKARGAAGRRAVRAGGRPVQSLAAIPRPRCSEPGRPRAQPARQLGPAVRARSRPPGRARPSDRGDAARARPAGRGAGPAAQARAARRGGAGAVQGVPRRQLRLRGPGAHQVRGGVRREGAADRARAAARRPPARDRRAAGRAPRAAAARAGRARARSSATSPCVAQQSAENAGAAAHRGARAAGRPCRRRARRARAERDAGRARWRAWCRPTRALQAQLFAPSSAIGFVRPEQPVLLRYQAFPYQKFGHQTRPGAAGLAHAAAAGRAGRHAAGRRATAHVGRAAVPHHRGARPARTSPPTARRSRWRPGMQLEADVLLDRRRLIEWMFEPRARPGRPACERGWPAALDALELRLARAAGCR